MIRKHKTEFTPTDAMRIFDVKPWIAGPYREPRFARLRWRLRKHWRIKARPLR